MEEVDTSEEALWPDFAFRMIPRRRQSFGMEHAVIGPDPTSRRVTAPGNVGGTDRIGDCMKSKMSTHTHMKMEHQLQGL